MTSNPNRSNGQFQFHSQAFQFGVVELAGLKMFLTEPSSPPTATPAEITAGKTGNCIACHAAPNFTDFKLHNTGTAQKEYDDIHGVGQFAGLSIPNLATRNGNYNQFLPATEPHPVASEPFRAIPLLTDPALTDLGIWNVLPILTYQVHRRRFGPSYAMTNSHAPYRIVSCSIGLSPVSRHQGSAI